MTEAGPPRASRRPPSVAACAALAVLAALVGLGLRVAVPPSAPAGGAEAAYRQFQRIREGLPPGKAEEIERVWRRLGVAPPPP